MSDEIPDEERAAWNEMAGLALERVLALHSPNSLGNCGGCATHVTFTPMEKCKTRAAIYSSTFEVVRAIRKRADALFDPLVLGTKP